MVACTRDSNSDVTVYDTNSWKKIVNRKQTQADRSCVVLSDDGQQLLIGLADCRVELWDLVKLGTK
jgi:WD40 repeat protein